MTQREAHSEIMRRLRYRHAQDVSDGEVMVPDRSSMRIDFLAMAASWSRPQVTAYEVKVSRQDFVRDDKWPAYLPACNSLIFVTAPGVATLGEIPEACGWQELSKNGAVLLTRKKAPWRTMDAEVEARLYKGMLMRVGKKGIPNPDKWREWLAEKRDNRRLGELVGREIRQTVKERIDKVQRESKAVAERCANLEHVRALLTELGIDAEAVARGRTCRMRETLQRAVEVREAGPLLTEAEALAEQLAALVVQARKFSGGVEGMRHRITAAMAAELATPVVDN